ncbi:MAG: peptidoglycan DD-metalloendopeptidase family protein [Leptothrix ochracea]|uniref:peptidoglycan DD-metalloendopeptidase family protein n=1 Tax=Leptothrix ochracea TaxID=735331 RepID=UPI0034E19BE3
MKTPRFFVLMVRAWLSGLMLITMVGCATNLQKTSSAARPPLIVRQPPAFQAPPVEASRSVADNNRPGYYTVKPGDTLIRIGLETGQNWRDLQRWNNLERPNLIEVGQVLRLTPSMPETTAVTSRVPSSALRSPMPTSVPPTQSVPSVIATTPLPPIAAPVAEPVVVPVAAATTVPASSRDAGETDLIWLWPATGPLVSSFDENRNKGVAIAGKAGDPVFAAADGRVVYAGSGLRGYGNLIIVKHNEVYLTAYAHNQTLLVKEDQPVKRGQKIAEMGASDTDRIQLHFEVRKRGKPIDPTRILPMR